VAFVKTTWLPGRTGGTQITAAQLNRMEQGIADAHLGVAVAQTTIAQGFPAGPVDGQEHVIVVNSSVSWRFKFDGASWKFIGGPALINEGTVATDQTTINTWIAQAGTASLVLALPGDYEVWHGHWHWHTVGGSVIYQDAVVNNATRATGSIGQAITEPSGGGVDQYSVAAVRRITGVPANATVNLQTWTSAATGKIRPNWMRVQPVRLDLVVS
jgi:hypothetical protein